MREVGLLVAHQGGWDEFLLFAIPAALALAGLRWAERRARRNAAKRASSSPQAADGTSAQDGAQDGSGPPGSEGAERHR